jgi:hypothetical protein
VLTSIATSNGPEPFGIFVLARVPLSAVKNSVSVNDYVLFCTAAMKRKRTRQRRTGEVASEGLIKHLNIITYINVGIKEKREFECA